MPEVIATLSLEEMMSLGKDRTFEDVVKELKKMRKSIDATKVRSGAVRVSIVLTKKA